MIRKLFKVTVSNYKYDFFVLETDSQHMLLIHSSGLGEVGRGRPPYCEPDVILTATLHDLQSMLHGQLKPYAAYMSGKLKVDGDLRTAMQLEEVVKKLKEAEEHNKPEEWMQIGSVVGHIPE